MHEDSNSGNVRYRIDSRDRLTGFNAAWDEFAIGNDTPALTGSLIEGRPLWDFITSPEVQHLYEVLLKRVRAGRALSSLPFRCDAPTLRRHMLMDIHLLPVGDVEFCCQVTRVEPRAPVPVDYGARPAEGNRFLRMCSWCNRVDDMHGHWSEIEDAIARLQLFGDVEPLPISHTICAQCLSALDGEADQ